MLCRESGDAASRLRRVDRNVGQAAAIDCGAQLVRCPGQEREGPIGKGSLARAYGEGPTDRSESDIRAMELTDLAMSPNKSVSPAWYKRKPFSSSTTEPAGSPRYSVVSPAAFQSPGVGSATVRASNPKAASPAAILPRCRMLVAAIRRGGMSQAMVVNEATDVDRRIRQVIGEHGRLPVGIASLGEDSDLYQAGMTSHASVNLMLGLEAEFDVEFPDAMLKRSVFQSVASIRGALEQLGVSAA